jgi:hypothetical protein
MKVLFASQFKYNVKHALVIKVLNIPHYVLVWWQLLQDTNLVARRLKDTIL